MGGRGSAGGYSWQSQLKQMAKQGQMPKAIMGPRDVQKQVFEMIDKLYPMPQSTARSISDQGDAYYVDFGSKVKRSSFPSGNTASPAEKNGVLKWLLWENK